MSLEELRNKPKVFKILELEGKDLSSIGIQNAYDYTKTVLYEFEEELELGDLTDSEISVLKSKIKILKDDLGEGIEIKGDEGLILKIRGILNLGNAGVGYSESEMIGDIEELLS